MNRRPSPYQEPTCGHWLKPSKCDTCGQSVPWDPWKRGDRRRFRHEHCPPPTLPVSYRAARGKLIVIDGRPRPARVIGHPDAPRIRSTTIPLSVVKPTGS